MSGRSLATGVILFSLCWASVATGQERLDPPLTNWSAPPFWSAGEAPAGDDSDRDFAVSDAGWASASLGNDGPRFESDAVPGEEQGAAEALPSLGMPFVAVQPCRAIDTRGLTPPPAHGGPALTSGVGRDFDMRNLCGIPVGALAISVNATVTGTGATTGAWLTLWPAGTAYPGVSTVNWSAAGQTLANAAIVPLGDQGGMTAAAFGGATHLIVDVNGYYTPFGVLSSSAVVIPETTDQFQGLFRVGTISMGGFPILQAWDSNKLDGIQNLFVGRFAGNGSMSAQNVTAIGSEALRLNTSGNANTAVGMGSLGQNTTGLGNTAVGVSSLSGNIGGNFNTGLGFAATVQGDGLTNATAIGANAQVDASNKVRIGNGTVTSIGGQVAWTAFSDGRGKKDIEDLSVGMEFVRKLRPVSYRLKNGNDRLDMGFVAQDLEALLGDEYNVVDIGADKNRTLALRYTDLIAPLVKAMQEFDRQSRDEMAALREENAAQKVELTQLRERLVASEAQSAITAAWAARVERLERALQTPVAWAQPAMTSNPEVAKQ